MAAEDDASEIRRRFEAAIADMGLDDLRRLAGQLASYRAPTSGAQRPDRRVPRRDQPALFRVRVDLEHARPPIWRRLDIRSDIGLDALHQVLQAAFGWWDSHLHRFALGPSVFDTDSQLFLCPFDVDEGEEGIPTPDVRLDETLAHPGHVLRYTYDYGDSWDLTIKLEKVLPLSDRAPIATCVDGRRAAPPEDCGGFRDADDLATVLDDPARFDVHEVNQALQTTLQSPSRALTTTGVYPRLITLLDRLARTPIGDQLQRRIADAAEQAEPAPQDKAAALRAHLWFLERAADAGIELTSAGYLKPADVQAASQVVPTMADWIGANNREIHTYPVLLFRESLQQLGLLRKRKGTLVLTRAGAAARTDPDLLWSHLATHLPIGKDDTIAADAGLLTLAYVAINPDETVPLGDIARALNDLGWRHADGRPLDESSARQAASPTLDVLENIASQPRSRNSRDTLSPAARALARAALMG